MHARSTRNGEPEGRRADGAVTGASYGIGVDLAECFAQDGYDLVLSARSEAALTEQAERIAKQYGVKVAPIAIDLGAQGAGHRLADEVRRRGITVDVVVNNAGYGIAAASPARAKPTSSA
jgi:short-subunit dehydrogenase